METPQVIAETEATRHATVVCSDCGGKTWPSFVQYHLCRKCYSLKSAFIRGDIELEFQKESTPVSV